jgi:hypothetical protein
MKEEHGGKYIIITDKPSLNCKGFTLESYFLNLFPSSPF